MSRGNANNGYEMNRPSAIESFKRRSNDWDREVHKCKAHRQQEMLPALADYLSDIAAALREGAVELSDDHGTLVLKPDGLVRLEIRGQERAGESSLDIHLLWRSQPAPSSPLQISKVPDDESSRS